MRVLLTGINGNLGFEVARQCATAGIDVVPVVRSNVVEHPELPHYERVVTADLTYAWSYELPHPIDYIVHCAGDVNFLTARDSNQNMIRTVLEVAEKLSVPIVHVSTAFIYRPHGDAVTFNNAYECDKHLSERLLSASGIPHTIIRPGVIVGRSSDGTIRNFSGYYLVVGRFLEAVRHARRKGRTVRFPAQNGYSNILPVDQVAVAVLRAFERPPSGEVLYATNPKPPTTEWLLNETLAFFGIERDTEILDCSFETFTTLDLTDEERVFAKFAAHMNPYWSLTYDFPTSTCSENLIDVAYLQRALTYYRNTAHISL